MKLRNIFKVPVSFNFTGDSQAETSLVLTGILPDNPSEQLIQKIMGERKIASIVWLKCKISEALYREEIHQGGWATDLGACGPGIFEKEATQILSNIRPEFASLKRSIHDHFLT